MAQYLKKFEAQTKCSDEKCQTMITEAHNDRLLCDPCFEVYKRNFRLGMLAEFGYKSPYLDSGGFGDLPRHRSDYGYSDI